MVKIINNFFSDKYINHKGVDSNFILLLIYRIAYPFAVLLHTLKFTPNQITTTSIFFTILGFFSLTSSLNSIWFISFWSLAILFDFCDGTVARMTLNIGKTEFRYDHISDLLKISLIILGIGIHYNNYLVWVISFISVFIFLFSDLLNYQLDYALNKKEVKNNRKVSNKLKHAILNARLRNSSGLVAIIVKNDTLFKVVKNIYTIFFTVNGHTLFIFIFAQYSLAYALYALFYFILLNSLSSATYIFKLNKLKR